MDAEVLVNDAAAAAVPAAAAAAARSPQRAAARLDSPAVAASRRCGAPGPGYRQRHAGSLEGRCKFCPCAALDSDSRRLRAWALMVARTSPIRDGDATMRARYTAGLRDCVTAQ